MLSLEEEQCIYLEIELPWNLPPSQTLYKLLQNRTKHKNRKKNKLKAPLVLMHVCIQSYGFACLGEGEGRQMSKIAVLTGICVC